MKYELIKRHKVAYSECGTDGRLNLFSISLLAQNNMTEYWKKIGSDNLVLKESTRDDIMPIIENKNGTLVYRSYILNLFKNINQLQFIKYAYLDSLKIDNDKYIKALKCFYDFKNNKISFDEGIDILNSLGLDYEDGFLYKDSVYQKEELKND